MMMQAIELEGRSYVIVPRDQYDRLVMLSESIEMPALPDPDRNGNYPAVEYARVSLARKLLKGRVALGLSRQELADLAGLKFETVNRIESGTVTPSGASIEKIDSALKAAEKKKSRAKRGS